jgi:hypothetical protein
MGEREPSSESDVYSALAGICAVYAVVFAVLAVVLDGEEPSAFQDLVALYPDVCAGGAVALLGAAALMAERARAARRRVSGRSTRRRSSSTRR